MKIDNRAGVILVAAVFVGGAAVFTQGQNASPASKVAADRETVRELNEKCLHAYDIGDAKTLDQMEGDDFTISGEFGEVTKQQHLARVRESGGVSSPVIRKFDNQQFRFYGDAVLVTEVDRASSTGGSSAYASTTLWVRQADTWKLVHLHYSDLKKATRKGQ